MDFELSEEQTMLKDSLDRFVRENYEPAKRRALVDSNLGYSKENWALFSEMGWLGLPFSEDSGGFGGSPVETSVLMESFGAGLVLEPYLSTVLLCGKLIEAAGSETQRSEILPAVIGGEMLLALALSEPRSRFNLANVETVAASSTDGFVITGRKTVVSHAASADKLIVSCRTSGAAQDQSGISLFLVDQNVSGLSRKDYRTLDGQRASDLELTGVTVGEDDLLGELGGGHAVLEAVIDQATCAICAEAVGAMQAVNEITMEYVKTRQQFGAPIGSNQVIKHRIADMHIAAEQSKSMADMAAMRVDGPPEERRLVTSAAKSKVGEAARFVGEQGIQLHGGIGMTDEYVIGHYYKRLMSIDTVFGNVDFHLRRYSEMT